MAFKAASYICVRLECRIKYGKHFSVLAVQTEARTKRRQKYAEFVCSVERSVEEQALRIVHLSNAQFSHHWI